MSLSSNNFDKNQPTKGSGSFATAVTRSSNTFASEQLNKNTDIPSGDNTSGGIMGGDFGTYGNIYGQAEFGGLLHFQNRTKPPAITH